MRRLFFGIAGLLLGFFALNYCSTLTYGQPDSDYYVYASRTLREGRGLLNAPVSARSQAYFGVEDQPMTTWPPLYPTLLSLFDNPVLGARVINAVSLVLTLILLVSFLRLLLPDRVGLWGGIMVAALLSEPFHTVFTTLLSDSVFLPLTLFWLLLLCSKTTRRTALLSGVCASLMFLERYVGVIALPFGLLVYLATRQGRHVSLLYVLLPAVVIFAWLGRNFVLTGNLTGHSMPAWYDLGQARAQSSGTLISWIPLLVLGCGAGWLVDLGGRQWIKHVRFPSFSALF